MKTAGNELAKFDSAIEKVKFEIDNPTSPREIKPISVSIEFNKKQIDQWIADAAAKYMPIKKEAPTLSASLDGGNTFTELTGVEDGRIDGGL